MARDAFGNYTLPAIYEVAVGDALLIAQHNTPLEDIETELTDSLSRSGQGAMLAALDMGGFRIEDVDDPTADSHAMPRSYADSRYLRLSAGAGQEVSDVVTFSGDEVRVKGTTPRLYLEDTTPDTDFYIESQADLFRVYDGSDNELFRLNTDGEILLDSTNMIIGGDGTDCYIDNDGGGDVNLRVSGDDVFRAYSFGGDYEVAVRGLTPTIKFDDTSPGDNCYLYAQSGTLWVKDTSRNDIVKFQSGDPGIVAEEAIQASGGDIEVGHGGTNAYIDNLGSGELDLRCGGNTGLKVYSTGNVKLTQEFRCQDIYDSTTGNSANVNVASDGRLKRSTSARKYKQDIVPMPDDAWEGVWDLQPVHYRSACKGDDQTQILAGIIADDALPHLPKLVAMKGDEVEGFDYARLSVYLLQAVKHLKARIEELEKGHDQ